MAILTPALVYRRYETDGVPDSGAHEPKKAEIIQLLDQIQGATSGPSIVKQTVAALNAVTPPTENYGGLVLNDPDPTKNGYYNRVAAAWAKGRGFPDTFAQVLLSGSANARTGSVSAGVNPADIKVFFAVAGVANTGPMTLTISGAPARAVINLVGNPLAAGEWTGMVMFYLNDANQYQLLIDAGAAASAAASATEAGIARDEALSAAGEATGRALIYPPTGPEVYDAGGRKIGNAARATEENDVVTLVDLVGSAPVISKQQRVVDAHWRCMKGMGYLAAEGIGEDTFTISSPITAGATQFNYSGTAPLANQLLVFLGADGEYYTNGVYSAAAGVCVVHGPMEAAVSPGANCWSFFNDNAHPALHGFKALIDYAMREDFASWTQVARLSPFASGGAVTVSDANNTVNPGSVNSRNGWLVTPAGANTGAGWQWTPRRSGWHRIVMQCNKFAGSGDVTYKVSQSNTLLASYAVKTTDARRHDIEVFVPNTRPVSIVAHRTADAFIVSNLMVLRMDLPPADINRGKHMVLGDSWVALDYGFAAPLADRLDRATVLKSGIGGNNAASLIARFNADVASVPDLDFVWVVVGTNDAAGAVTPEVFGLQIANLCSLIAAIGATPILVTPFTGSDDFSDRYDFTRRYVTQVAYYRTEAVTTRRHSIATFVPASVATPILSLGLVRGDFRVLESYLSHACDLQRGAAHPATTTTVASIASGWVTTPVAIDFRPVQQFVQLVRTAGGGGGEFVSGYIDIEEVT